MISSEQIKRIAKEEGLSTGVVEKDYAITWLLKGLYQKNSRLRDNLVLKGGTAIRKVYFPQTWRFSEDLDFTVLENTAAGKIRESMQDTFEIILTESGINYSFESFHTTEGAIIANVQFSGPLHHVNRIRHDITLKEKIVLKPEWRPIKAKYPDLKEFEVQVYSLIEILVEKIRSIMQRGYSRDYYDVWRLLNENEFEDTEISRLLRKKCELKDIEYDPSTLFENNRLSEARSFWIKGLGYLTKDLPEFNKVITDLKKSLASLQDTS